MYTLPTHSFTRSGSLVDEVKFGDKIKEWLPQELMYKAFMYVFHHKQYGILTNEERKKDEGNKKQID